MARANKYGNYDGGLTEGNVFDWHDIWVLLVWRTSNVLGACRFRFCLSLGDE